MTEPPKYCCYAWCGQLLTRRPGEATADWNSRKGCGQGKHRDDTVVKICPQCGVGFTRAHRESRSNFAGRTYCSRKCRDVGVGASLVGKEHRPSEKEMLPRQKCDWPDGVHFTDDPAEATRLVLFIKFSPPDTVRYSLAGCTAFFAADHRHAGI